MMPILPPEIWDHIIDCLQEDYSTLTTCMLVCKSWKPRSQHRLPSRMEFLYQDEVVQAVRDSGKLWKGPESVRILGDKLFEAMHEPPRDGCLPPLHHLSTFATMLAGKWTRVQELLIERAEWRAGDMPMANIFLHLSAFSSSITTLTLSLVTIPSIVTLRQLIFTFRNLRSLSCSYLSFREHGTPPAFKKWPQQLSSLKISGSGVPITGVANLLLAAGIVSHLHHLCFSYPAIQSPEYARALACLQALVDVAGTSLRTLLLSYQSAPRDGDRVTTSTEVSYLSLVPSLKLETIHLSIFDACESTDYEWVLWCFSRITSNVIKKVGIMFWQSADNAMVDETLRRICEDCCARLDKILCSLATFANLEQVSFNIYNVSAIFQDDWALFSWLQMTSQMPRLYKRGILRIWINGVLISPSMSQISTLVQEPAFVGPPFTNI